MINHGFRWFRFSLSSLLILILGIAIGYSLNLTTLRLLTRQSTFPTALAPYVIEPPDVLQVQVSGTPKRPITVVSGQHLVGPDGRINLGDCGSLYVSGLTLDEGRQALEKHLSMFIDRPQVSVDVYAYNSKNYYVILQGAAGSDTVQQFPITGNETVLDAFAHLGNVPVGSVSSIFVVRPPSNGIGMPKRLPIDWDEIKQGNSMETNYQLLPRDRLVIQQTGKQPS